MQPSMHAHTCTVLIHYNTVSGVNGCEPHKNLSRTWMTTVCAILEEGCVTCMI